MAKISDHDNKMHRGPHHEKFIHVENKRKGSHKMGDKSHLKSLKGEPHGADVKGHKGKMHW